MLLSFTPSSSTQIRPTGFVFGHHSARFRSLTVVASILVLLGVAALGLVHPASAQDYQYSPYWGVNGELWNPNGPLKDHSRVGYHQGDDPIPYGQRAASLSFGEGRFTITSPISIKKGVLRGAGKDKTVLYFPKGLVGMGYPCSQTHADPNNCWDWGGAVIEMTGSEVAIEDLTIEFPPHKYTHHNGQGFNGIYLNQCRHCWVKNVRVLNADEGIGIFGGDHNTIDGVEIVGGYHNYIHMTVTKDNLVTNFQVSGGSIHGLTANWDTHGGVFSKGVGYPVVIEPNHSCPNGCRSRGPSSSGLLYSDIQGTSGKLAGNKGDAFFWNYMNQKLYPLDIYHAQLAESLGIEPDPGPTPPTVTTWLVNAGGGSYTDGEGYRWSADQAYTPGGWGYIGGKTYSTGDAIANTVDDPLYQKTRYGNFSYKFDVPNGEYDVTLYFSEIYWKAVGRRLFDVYVEGQLVLDNYDIYSAAGHDAAVAWTVQGLVVNDGQITIQFSPMKDNAMVSAIVIQRVGD